MRSAIVAILALVIAAPALAAEGKGKLPTGQYVDISPVALPIIENGRLINFVFVTLRLDLNPSANAVALRDKEPYFRDALVRAAHRMPFVRPGDFNLLDEGKLKAAMYREAVAIAGPGKIKSVAVLSQTAQHRVAPARQGGGAAIVP